MSKSTFEKNFGFNPGMTERFWPKKPKQYPVETGTSGWGAPCSSFWNCLAKVAVFVAGLAAQGACGAAEALTFGAAVGCHAVAAGATSWGMHAVDGEYGLTKGDLINTVVGAVTGGATKFFGGGATNTATSRTFGIADRVAGQLDDVRLGSLRGQLGPDDLQRLVNARGAQRYYDTATGNINVIQQVDDVLLRITTASDEFKIISVGPIRPNQVTNGVTNGRFVPIGGAG